MPGVLDGLPDVRRLVEGGVDLAPEQGHGEQDPAQRRRGVAVAAQHVVREAALVQEDYRAARLPVGLDPSSKARRPDLSAFGCDSVFCG
jgi:hypothetical protein